MLPTRFLQLSQHRIQAVFLKALENLHVRHSVQNVAQEQSRAVLEWICRRQVPSIVSQQRRDRQTLQMIRDYAMNDKPLAYVLGTFGQT